MSRRDRAILCGIVAVSVLLRVAVALYLGDVVDAPANVWRSYGN
jgi:hypothetical protein